MIKKKLLILGILLCLNINTYSQNCTVNSDIDLNICENDALILNGSSSGLFQSPSDLKWTQIAGPSISISNPSNEVTSVIGFLPNNTYRFRLSATCRDGVRVFDDVRFTVLPVTTANAGPDQTACPGTSSLNANSPGTNETGIWSIIGSNNAGVVLTTPTSPTSPITTNTSSAGQTTLRWTITNTNNCFTTDDVVITNYGGESPVTTVTPNVTLGNCYSTTQCYRPNASFGGNGFGGQIGTWSQVSGPTNVTFSNVNARNPNICNLSEGCYVVKWTVTGPCVNGSDTVRICVPPPTQSVTTASSSNQVFCDGRTTAILTGNAAIYSGENVLWQQISGPTTVTFIDSTSNVTGVSGLNGSSTYTFRYTITNPSTGCSSSSTVSLSYRNATPFIAPVTDTVLACGIDNFSTTLSVTGGSQTYYRIMSAPDSFTLTTPTNEMITGNSLVINGLDAPGTYVIRLRRTVNSGVECSDFSRDFNIIVSDVPQGANAGTNQLLQCNVNSTTLAGNRPNIGFGSWSQISGPSTAIISDIHDPQTAATAFISGVYFFRWTINGGPTCPKVEDDVKLTFSSSTPQSVSAGTNRTVCFGSSYRLDANVPIDGEVGEWTVSPSATINDLNDPKTVISGLLANTVYTFKWKVTNLCGVDSSTVQITTNNTQGPPQANAGSDRCLPSGTTSLQLNGNNPSPASGLWTKLTGPNATIANDTLFNTNITGLTNGIYTFEWRNTSGICDPTFDTIQITISGPVTIADAGTDKDSCSNSVTMNANTPTTGIGTWSQLNGPAGWEVSDINDPNAQFTNLITGDYTFAWTISNGNCASSIDSVKITIDNIPTFPSAGLPQRICGSSTLTLTGNNVENGLAIWSVLDPSPSTPIFANPEDSSTLVSGLVTGIYTFLRTANSIGGICPSLKDTVPDTVVINSNAGVDQEYCGNRSSVELRGPEASIGTWTKITGGSATITTISPNTVLVTNTSPSGSPYQFVFTVPARWGCPQTVDTMQLILHDTTVIPNAGTDQNICTATSVTLNGNDVSPNTGTWTQIFGPTTTITSNSIFNTTVTNINTAGIYLYRWTAVSGSCRRSDEVRIEKFDPPTVSNAGADQTICPESTNLTGNSALIGVGNWSQLSGPVSVNIEEQVNPNTLVTGFTAVGTYTFEWAIENGPSCPVSRDTVAINVPFLNPTTADAGIDSNICNRTSTSLNGNSISIGSGQWSQYTSTPSSTISNNNVPNPSVTLTISGIYGYVWTATNGGCVSRDTTIYTLSDLPVTSDAGTNINSCIGEPIVLNGNNPSPNTGTWRKVKLTDPAVFSNENDPMTSVFGIGIGTYNFEWVITSGSCPSSRDTVEVEIVQRPADAIAGLDQFICSDSLVLNGSSDSIGSPTWAFISGPSTPNLATPGDTTTSVTGLTSGTYYFEYSIHNGGCTNRDTMEVFYNFPMINNSCANADSLTTSVLDSGLDSLCAATAEVGEPGTCGKPACNSLIYKFRTNPSVFYKDLVLNFTQISDCSNGLRVSLFFDGPCPTMGSQVGSCQTISAVGDLVFPNLAPNTVYYIVVDDNSPTCGASSCSYRFNTAGALPVVLVDFNASLNNEKNALLKWNTVTEINSSRFDIMRRLENENSFTKVGEVKAAGNSNELIKYSFIDSLNNINSNLVYYKLNQVDFNGSTNSSETKVLTLNNDLNLEMVVFPNPANSSFSIKIKGVTNNYSYTIIDALGKIVQQGITKNNETININGLAKGVYHIKVMDKELSENSSPLIIQ